MGQAEVNAEQLILLSNGLPSRYKVESILGTGGMGIVLAAQDLQLSRKVAIKVLQIEGQNDTNVQARFASEAKALASLDHPNIVKLLTWGMSESGNPYLVLELVQGEALSEILERQGKLTPRQFQQIFSQVLAGLRHAHEHNIVHRDLKPGNLIVTIQDSGEMIIKIIDFGVAKFLEPGTDAKITSTLSLVGSPAYMSPEQCKGQTPDFRSDIYSLACIMYQGLTGKLPFESDNSIDLMYKHTNADWSLLESLVIQPEFAELAKLIDRCLAKNPEERPQSTVELSTVLARVFAGQTTSNKLFVLKGEKKTGGDRQGIIHAAVLAGLLLTVVGFLGAQIILERKHKIEAEKTRAETQVERQEERQVESREQTVASLKKQIASLERDFKHEKDKDRQKEIIASIINRSRKLGKELADQRRHKDAAAAYQRVLNYSQYQDEPGIARSDAYRLIAKELSASGNYGDARELCKRGIDELKKSSNADGDTIAFLYLLKAENDLYLRDFAEARRDFKQVGQVWSDLSYLDPGSPVSMGAERDRLNAMVNLFKLAGSCAGDLQSPEQIESARALRQEISLIYSRRKSRAEFLQKQDLSHGFMKNLPVMRDTLLRDTVLDNVNLPEGLVPEDGSKNGIKTGTNSAASSSK